MRKPIVASAALCLLLAALIAAPAVAVEQGITETAVANQAAEAEDGESAQAVDQRDLGGMTSLIIAIIAAAAVAASVGAAVTRRNY